MSGLHHVMRDARLKARGGYVLIVRGADGRTRFERFNDAASYRARLVSLNAGHRSENDGLSIEEIAGLLDP